MKLADILKKMVFFLLTWLSIGGILAKDELYRSCQSLGADQVIRLECSISSDRNSDSLCLVRMCLEDDFKGSLCVDKLRVLTEDMKITAVSSDTTILLKPMINRDCRSCDFVSDCPLMRNKDFRIHIPKGIFRISPEFKEVDLIDYDEEKLSSFSVAGAWHKKGSEWKSIGMFSVIDDDSLDGQILSSKPGNYTYGYYSLLYPLLESLGIRGNLAAEGKRIGLTNTLPSLNDNGKTLLRLQDEKGWDILCHSMECLGAERDNWLVDSLDSPIALRVFQEGPFYGTHTLTASVYDMKSQKQYWPNADKTGWEETPSRYIKPYVADYVEKKELFYNPDFDAAWHWGEWKRRAEEFGIHAVGFVTHNSTSSHALVPAIREYFPNGLSDIAAVNINYPPMLSSGVRSGLEGQSMGDYNGNSTDNTFNEKHYRKFCSQIDEAMEKGGWIIFNLHAYRDVWKNSLPGALVSEGGSYPDEWVIPMKGMDSANDSLTPPAHLGISDWSEWYPCPGTRLEMMWKVLKYAKEKGLKNVTCSEGFEVMGNKTSVGYFNNGYKFGMDIFGLKDTEDVYPHYMISATGEVSYYNPLVLDEIDIELSSIQEVGQSPRFLISDGRIVWSCADPVGITLEVWDLAGRKVSQSPANSISLDLHRGVYMVCAIKGGSILGSLKIVR